MEIGELKQSILFMKYRIWRPGAISRYHELLRNERLSSDELHSMNWERTKALLTYAYEKVPFYQRKFRGVGMHPNDVMRREDYDKVPILTKDELRRHFTELLSPDANARHLRMCSTGGSTGMPVKVMVDRRVPQEAYAWRVMRWWGVAPGVDTAYVWRFIRKGRIERAQYSLAHWPTRKIFLDASCMTKESMKGFVDEFNRVRPALLQGYVGAIHHLASYIHDSGSSVHAPRAIWVTSSPMTAIQRHRIESVFQCPVYDQYGCGEVSWLAAQCGRRGGLHMFHDARLIEFVDEAGRTCPAGRLGRVLLTNLENHLFPIIRYENGDMGRELSGVCPCGCSLPLMNSVQGRATDLVRLPGGTCISGDYLTTLFDDYPGAVAAFQVHQQADYSIRVVFVPNSGGDELAGALEKVRGELLRKTMSQVPVSFESVREIPHDRGKLRFVVSSIGTGRSDG